MHIPRRLLKLTAARIVVVAAAGMLVMPEAAAAQTAHGMYTQALARERQVRDAASKPTLAELRSLVRAYENVVRRHPRSGYSDNALWQGGNIALLAFERFGDIADKRTALRLLNQLKDHYPSSSLVPRALETIKQAEATRPPPAKAATAAPRTTAPAQKAAPPPPKPAPVPAPRIASTPPAVPSPPRAAADDAVSAVDVRDADGGSDTDSSLVTIRDIRRTPLPNGARVSIEMDGESLFRAERLESPRRVFFDLPNTRTVVSLQDATIRVGDGIVNEIRFGRHPNNTTRIVMELDGADSYSVFTLYNPFRLVVDLRLPGAPAPPAPIGAAVPAAPVARPSTGTSGRAQQPDAVAATASAPVPLVARPAPALVSPTPPAANANGRFSIARQLGLGVYRIVLDAGHGGHDPGARAHGISEAELVLDVTLRLRALLEKQPGFEVTLTRDKDVFVPLEERTAIANRQDADLFLSIHANASRNPNAHGIETYFLNFASNPDAAAVAARENASSGRAMHHLPEIVRAIALNNKIDESRDFATMIQTAMVRRLSARNKDVRDLGVKQAPFVVLIGATMPSVLAEISFVTHRQEAALLKTPAYRQHIAEALLDGILRYQASLKGMQTIAAARE
jgi:N-acetylmuramoyl-L-alanine amidase